MLFDKKIYKDNSSIAIWQITETVSELLTSLKNKDVYLPEFQLLKSEKRQKEWLCSRLLVQELCGENKKICYNEYGKPYVHDHSWQISISHTKNYVSVICNRQKEVGIDIEAINDRICSLKERFLNKEELDHIDPQQEKIHLLLHWGAKEVLFKMMNQQNVDFSGHLHISPFAPQKNGTFFGKEMCTKQQENYTFAYYVYDDFTMVWSVK